MPSKRKRKLSMAEKISISTALIGFAGVLIAALITVMPKILEVSRKTPDAITATPFAYNQYDDPTGLFSIEYPAYYYVTQRELSSSDLLVAFGAVNTSDASTIVMLVNVSDDPEGAKKRAEDVMQYALGGDPGPGGIMVWQGSSGGIFNPNGGGAMTPVIPTPAPVFLISNKKTQRGYYLHYMIRYKETDLHDYLLFESEDNAAGSITIIVDGKDANRLTQGEIDHIVSTFQWSASTARQLFTR